jgi:tetratricopeptide (TPR) repeat protein
LFTHILAFPRPGGRGKIDVVMVGYRRLVRESITMRDLRRSISLLLVLGMATAGCARSPEAKKARWLGRGDSYFGRQQYREAIIEYRNVLRIDASNARAMQQLGLAYYQLGESAQAYPFLLKAKELDPNNAEVRLKLGTLYVAARQLKETREEANFLLEKDPKNFDALLLFAASASTPKEVAAAIRRLEAARADFGGRAKFHIALANLYLRNQDMAAAEGSFKEAVATEPMSIEGHTALGDFYLLRKNDVARAEQEYKAAADLAPFGSAARIKLADFYFLIRRPEAAKQLLAEISEKAPKFLPARHRLAEIAVVEQKYDESLKALEPIFEENPSDLEGLLLRGRVHLGKRETTAAIQDFQKVLRLEPRFARARYQLALAQLQAGNLQQAKGELKEATTIDPNFTDAVLLLAELDIQTGAHQPAIEALEKLIAKQPRTLQAYRVLGLAYLAKREPGKATGTFRKFVALAPKDPRGPYLVGLGLRAQGKWAEAKQQFEEALALAPDAVEPMVQLVEMALTEKRPQAALERVKRQIAVVPRSGALQYLLAEVYLGQGERAQAEAPYLKAIELEPRLVGAYLQLGRLYVASGRSSQALAKLNDALRVDPKNLVAHMLIGSIYQQEGDISKAQEAYEKVLALNPRFAPAANNLAYLYSEHGGDREKALQLAQTAKEMLPEDPRVSDTLGWILYKRGVYQRALGLVQEGAAKLPDNPEVHYHLGMIQYKLGNSKAAKQSLSRALHLSSKFPGATEARSILAE